VKVVEEGKKMRSIKEIDGLLLRIKNYLVSTYETGIKYLILYGSFGRGEATEKSDIDILVVVDDKIDPREVEEDLSDLLFEILLEHGELISVIVVKESIFEGYKSPLFLNVKEEGVII